MKLSARLWLLNAARWCREYWLSWGLLGLIYSVTLALIIQPILGRALGQELPLGAVWLVNALLLLLPGALELTPLPGLPSLLWIRARPGLAWIYAQHDFRRLNAWLGILLMAGVGRLWAGAGREILWVLIAQLGTQRALYSFGKWRVLALARDPRRGGSALLTGLVITQIVQATLAGLLFGGSLRALFAAAVGVLAAGAVALEGDAGRPWLVNFISLTAGAIAGVLSYLFPGTLLVVGYFSVRTIVEMRDRLHSVERMDEDVVIP